MKTPVILTALIIFSPIALCLIYTWFPLGSIGPLVLITWPLASIALPLIFFKIANAQPQAKVKITLRWLAIPCGLILAYLLFLSYMLLTPIFGLDDFYWF